MRKALPALCALLCSSELSPYMCIPLLIIELCACVCESMCARCVAGNFVFGCLTRRGRRCSPCSYGSPWRAHPARTGSGQLALWLCAALALPHPTTTTILVTPPPPPVCGRSPLPSTLTWCAAAFVGPCFFSSRRQCVPLPCLKVNTDAVLRSIYLPLISPAVPYVCGASWHCKMPHVCRT